MSIRSVATALCAAAILAVAPAQAQGEQELYDAAKKEGELTWYVAHFSAENAEAVGAAFTRKHPGVKVNVVRATSQVVMQRLMQDIDNAARNCDVFSSADEGHYVELEQKKLLTHYAPKNAGSVFQQFQGIDPDGFYHVTAAAMLVLAYQTELVKAEEAPTKWSDLADPKWKGKIALGHPAFSGSVGTWVVMLTQLYGWDYFEALEKNDPQIGRSLLDATTMLVAKERSVGAVLDAGTGKAISRGSPIQIVYPTDGSLLLALPSAIPANAPHPNAAKLFMEFLLSPEASKVAVEYFNAPLLDSVPPPKGMKSASEVKTLRPTAAEIHKGVPEAIERWRDTFGN
jgi:iron(III) transport system substrate-binding protein